MLGIHPKLDIFKRIKLLNLTYNLIHNEFWCMSLKIHPYDLFVRKEIGIVYIRMATKIMVLHFLITFVYKLRNHLVASQLFTCSLLPLYSSRGEVQSGKSVKTKNRLPRVIYTQALKVRVRSFFTQQGSGCTQNETLRLEYISI